MNFELYLNLQKSNVLFLTSDDQEIIIAPKAGDNESLDKTANKLVKEGIKQPSCLEKNQIKNSKSNDFIQKFNFYCIHPDS